MKRAFLVLISSLALASSAGAASLTLQAVGPTTVNPGDPIQLQLLATLTPPEATNSLGLDVRTVTSNLSVISWTGATQTGLTSFFGSLPWTVFAPICPAGNPAQCIAVNQANPVLPLGAQPDAFNGVLATINGVAGGPGTSTISVDVQDFFGVSGASAGTVLYTVIPEPGTLLLLGVGFGGLALAGRRQR